MNKEDFDTINGSSDKPHYLLKELHELLQHDPLMFEFLQDGLLDGMWYWDLENVEHEWMSPKLWLTLGYDPSEKAHLASEWQDLIFQEDLAVALQNFNRHIADPTHPYDQYVRYRHRLGRTIWVRCRGIAIHDSSGNAVRFLGGHVDVTNLMERQDALMSENLKLQQMSRKVDDIELQSAQLRAENNYLKQKAVSLEKYELDSCLATKGYFRQRANEFMWTSARLGLPINFMSIGVTNFKLIDSNFGEIELTNKKISLAEIVHNWIPDMVTCQFSEGVLIGVAAGLTELKATELIDAIVQSVKEFDWSIVEPEIRCHIVTHFDVDVSDKDLLDRLIVNAAQFTTL